MNAVALVLALPGTARARRTKAIVRKERYTNAWHTAEHDESTLAYGTAESDESARGYVSSSLRHWCGANAQMTSPLVVWLLV